MTQREIARLCCKVLAVYAFISSLQVIGGMLLYIGTLLSMSDSFMNTLTTVVGAIVGPLLSVVFAILLWKNAGIVAAWMTGHNLQDSMDEPDSFRIQASLRDVHTIAFSILGVWVLLGIIPDAADLISRIIFSESDQAALIGSNVLTRGVSYGLVMIFFRLVIGVWLLFGAKNLVRFLHKIRTIGLESSTSKSVDGKE